MGALVLYDASQYKPMIQSIRSPSKRITMVERIENIEYKRYVRQQAEIYFYFISYYWSFLGIPAGYVVSQVIFVIGIKGTPGATAAIATTLGAATSNIVIESANTALWGAYKTFNFFRPTPMETPQFEPYNLGKVAGNTVEGMSTLIDTIVPQSIRFTTMLGMMLLCVYLHYMSIDWINRARFSAKQSIG
jgi:hypothetical protein